MATVIGQSGAWQALAGNLSRLGHVISNPQALHPLLVELETTRPRKLDTRRGQTARAVQVRESQIAALSAEPGLFRRLFNWFSIRALRKEVSALYTAESDYSSALDRTINHVRALLESAELAGANAELAVIEYLRALPSSMVVFNDVRLQSMRRILFEGKALASAQIDHLVLTPAGVFVIETKCWSSRFVESGNFFDPFEQVSRAGYLCYDLLRWHFGKTRVRTVIASVGKLPEAPRHLRVAVVRPEHLKSYISAFCKVEVPSSRFQELRFFFEERVRNRSET